MVHLWIPPPYPINEEVEDEGNCNLLGITWQVNSNPRALVFDSGWQFSPTSPFFSFLAEGSCKEYPSVTSLQFQFGFWNPDSRAQRKGLSFEKGVSQGLLRV